MQHEKIRQFKRQDVSLRGVLRVHEDDRAQIHFSNTLESALSGKQMQVTVIDIGYGGLGLQTDVFIPRQARFEIEVFKKSTPGNDKDSGEILLKEQITAKRYSMVSRDPRYFVGMGFDSVSVDLKSHLDEFFGPEVEEKLPPTGLTEEEMSSKNRGDRNDS